MIKITGNPIHVLKTTFVTTQFRVFSLVHVPQILMKLHWLEAVKLSKIGLHTT